MGKLRVTDTSLRDGHQSLWATRMATEDMLPVLEKIDNVGYHSLEVWGGATFDVCIRYLNEDPWERLRVIRSVVQKTQLQMLLRGQSVVGYSHYPDDVVYKFVERAAANGIDIFRVFDALNDIRNLETAMKAVKATGKHVQACIVYTVSPVHSINHFASLGMQLRDMGADSICIKDMAGLLAPYVAYDLVRILKEKVQLPVQLHTHYVGGLAVGSCLKGAEAGVDVIDTASVPMAFGSSQPPVETLVRALQDSEWDTGLDLHELFEIADHFEKIRKHKGFERGVTKILDMKVFDHQVPGGMISNFINQLEEQKASHKLDEVMAEIPLVRKDLGYPPLVTPTSQIVGTQAVLNVLMGERYKMSPAEVKDYVRGLYGKPPASILPEIRQKIIGDETVMDVRPADLLEPGWEKAKKEVAHLVDSDEDVLTYVLFPQVAIKFFETRKDKLLNDGPQITINDEMAAGEKAESKPAGSAAARVPYKAKPRASTGGDEEMRIDEIRELILMLDGSGIAELEIRRDDFSLALRKPGSQKNSPTAPAAVVAARPVEPLVEESEEHDYHEISSPMVGTFYRAPSPDAPPYVQIGDRVKAGQTVCIVEAMKLMNELKSEFDGVIVDILVDNAQPVEFGQVLFYVEVD